MSKSDIFPALAPCDPVIAAEGKAERSIQIVGFGADGATLSVAKFSAVCLVLALSASLITAQVV